jgi:hypothetical protein
VNYSQAFTNATTVTLTHNAGTLAVQIECFDDNNESLFGKAGPVDINTAVVEFAVAKTGACNVNYSGGGPGSGGVDTTAADNSGSTGASVLKPGTNVTGRKLRAISGVTITETTDDITFEVTGGGGGSYISSSTITVGTGSNGCPLGQLCVNGDAIPTHLPGAASLTFGTISNGACADLTMPLAGALNGDRVVPGWPASLPTGWDGIQFVSAANTVTIRLCNHTGGSATPSAGMTFSPMILRGF